MKSESHDASSAQRVARLRRFAAAAGDVAILVHPDPDPDALASALAVRALLRREPTSAPIVTLGEMTRPENRRMAELLRMRVTVITEAELQRLERVIAVDWTPALDRGSARPSLAIIDHHPCDGAANAELADIRPTYGATATILTEYLRADDERRIAEPLATALLYGIKTDTDSLARGSLAADVEAYAFLQNCADLELLRRLERPSYSVETARLYGRALTNLISEDDVAIVFLGSIRENDAHVLADIADFCLALEGITWAIAAAIITDNVVLTIRHLGGGVGAGELAEQLAEGIGSGGGHATMARATLPLKGDWRLGDDVAAGRAKLRELICSRLEPLRLSHRSARPAHPEPVHSATHK